MFRHFGLKLKALLLSILSAENNCFPVLEAKQLNFPLSGNSGHFIGPSISLPFSFLAFFLLPLSVAALRLLQNPWCKGGRGDH